MRSAPLLLLSVAVLLVAGCDCGRGRLVAANGGSLRVTLVGADPESGLLCVLFTTQPDGPLYYAVNAVQGAVV